jgi:photosystem II stability/assembly factor-like uncharacterized protein
MLITVVHHNITVQIQQKKKAACIAAFSLLICAFPSRAFTQVQSEVLLPGSIDTGQVSYTAFNCFDSLHYMVTSKKLQDGLYSGYVLSTTDGGINWQRNELPIQPWSDFRGRFFHMIYFIDARNIVLAGDSGLLFRSIDGGKNWSDQSFPSIAASASVAFLDSAHGIVCGGGGLLLQTSNAGTSWDSVRGLPDVFLTSPRMIAQDSFSVFQYGFGPLYYISDHRKRIDSTPRIVNLPDSTGYRIIGQVQWTNNLGEGIAIGAHRRPDQQALAAQTLLMKTTDGGYSWSILLDRDTRLSQGAFSWSLTGAGSMMLSGFGGSLIKTQNWRTGPWVEDSVIASVQFSEISSLAIIDDRHALAWLDLGDPLHSPNGGYIARLTIWENGVQTWEPIVYGTHIYPNPSSEIMTIISIDRSRPVHLFDILGRKVTSTLLDETGQARINIQSLPHGVYTVMIEHNGKLIPVGKVVTQEK